LEGVFGLVKPMHDLMIYRKGHDLLVQGHEGNNLNHECYQNVIDIPLSWHSIIAISIR